MNDIMMLWLLFFSCGMLLIAANRYDDLPRLNQKNSTPSGIHPYSYIVIILLIILIIGINLAITGGGETSIIEKIVSARPSSPSITAYGMIIPASAGLLCLFGPIRYQLAKIIPINPQRYLHAISLAMSMIIPINYFFTWGMGLSSLNNTVINQPNTIVVLTKIWMQQLLMVGLALIAIGYPLHRTGKQTIARVKISYPSIDQLGVGIIIGLLASFFINALTIWGQHVGWVNDSSSHANNIATIAYSSWIGIFTISVASAIGEETLFRGAVQPRFGLILTTILFVLSHAQYKVGFATLMIGMIGLMLGVLYQRYGVVMSLIVHAVYNMSHTFIYTFILFLIEML